MRRFLFLALSLMLLNCAAMAQSTKNDAATGQAPAAEQSQIPTQNSQQSAVPGTSGTVADDGLSGMYSFLSDGEFVQIGLEEDGRVTGIVSRFGDEPADKGTFLDQLFKSASFKAGRLTFRTETVHGVWWEFTGTVVRGPGKSPDEEGYRLLRGQLTRHKVGADKQDVAETMTVEFKSFPAEAAR